MIMINTNHAWPCQFVRSINVSRVRVFVCLMELPPITTRILSSPTRPLSQPTRLINDTLDGPEGPEVRSTTHRPTNDRVICLNVRMAKPNVVVETDAAFPTIPTIPDRVLMLAIRHAGGSPSVARLVMLMLIMVDVVSVLLLDSPLPINCEN